MCRDQMIIDYQTSGVHLIAEARLYDEWEYRLVNGVNGSTLESWSYLEPDDDDVRTTLLGLISDWAEVGSG